MMRAHRSGFTLVELIVVMVVGSLLLGAAYQTLIIQQRGYRTTGAVIGDQDALRVALGVLEAEIRETATIGGDIGGSDILMLHSDSVRIRAPRKLGFVCEVSPSDKSVIAWSEWDGFKAEDELLIFVDNDPMSYTDDEWEVATVQSVSSSNATCNTRPAGVPRWKVNMVAHPLDGVDIGAPMRAFTELTYGLYQIDGEWGLGRQAPGEPPALLVGGLAGPGSGLVFEYLTAGGATTTNPAAVASVRISMTTAAQPGSGTQPRSVTSTIYLRNN